MSEACSDTGCNPLMAIPPLEVGRTVVAWLIGRIGHMLAAHGITSCGMGNTIIRACLCNGPDCYAVDVIVAGVMCSDTGLMAYLTYTDEDCWEDDDPPPVPLEKFDANTLIEVIGAMAHLQ